LALVSADPAVVDLLLTDVLMPGLSGVELAGCVTATRPDIRVLFSSGATASATDETARLPRGAAFLPKPFTPEGLSQRVRALLAE
ncbi:MAG: response regulator, partial [Gemmatimonadaceae bacterium]